MATSGRFRTVPRGSRCRPFGAVDVEDQLADLGLDQLEVGHLHGDEAEGDGIAGQSLELHGAGDEVGDVARNHSGR
jgi:hypothetical protein